MNRNQLKPLRGKLNTLDYLNAMSPVKKLSVFEADALEAGIQQAW